MLETKISTTDFSITDFPTTFANLFTASDKPSTTKLLTTDF